jgi:ribosomal protein RSM22 (predicted rRNA methylase)
VRLFAVKLFNQMVVLFAATDLHIDETPIALFAQIIRTCPHQFSCFPMGVGNAGRNHRMHPAWIQ